jgi:hypothetical protein
MYMAGAVAASGYADSIPAEEGLRVFGILTETLSRMGLYELKGSKRSASYRLNTLAEDYFPNFINFTNLTGCRWRLRPSAKVVSMQPVADSYCLQDEKKAIICLESPNGESGHVYAAGTAALTGLFLAEGRYNFLIYQPDSGNHISSSVEIRNRGGIIHLPLFRDDLALLIN